MRGTIVQCRTYIQQFTFAQRIAATTAVVLGLLLASAGLSADAQAAELVSATSVRVHEVQEAIDGAHPETSCIRYGACPKYNEVLYDSVSNIANDLTVTVVADELEFVDPATTFDVGAGCRRINEHTARCQLNPLNISLGDGNDKLDSNAPTVKNYEPKLNLGGGNDTVVARTTSMIDAGSGNDTVAGSYGDDTVRGGPGHDTVSAGSGNDEIFDAERDAEAASDVYDGGEGHNWISYLSRSASVTVDLERGAEHGPLGETDTLRSVQSALGGQGNDTLITKSAPLQGHFLSGLAGNDTLIAKGSVGVELIGGFGDDRISGSEGADVVHGNIGYDTVNGGRGNDRIYGERGNDRLYGGDGNDLIDGGDDRDTITGGHGEDLLRGGKGHNLINARDGEADRLFCSGDGSVAHTDRRDSVRGGCRR